MTDQYEKALEDLGQSNAGDIGIDFEQGVWSRVSQIENARLSRGKNGLAAVMLIVALSAGLMTGEQEAYAQNSPNVLSGGTDYSPASLLKVIP